MRCRRCHNVRSPRLYTLWRKLTRTSVLLILWRAGWLHGDISPGNFLLLLRMLERSAFLTLADEYVVKITDLETATRYEERGPWKMIHIGHPQLRRHRSSRRTTPLPPRSARRTLLPPFSVQPLPRPRVYHLDGPQVRTRPRRSPCPRFRAARTTAPTTQRVLWGVFIMYRTAPSGDHGQPG